MNKKNKNTMFGKIFMVKSILASFSSISIILCIALTSTLSLDSIGYTIFFNQNIVYGVCIYIFLLLMMKYSNAYRSDTDADYRIIQQLIIILQCGYLLSKVNQKINELSFKLMLNLYNFNKSLLIALCRLLKKKNIIKYFLYIGILDLLARLFITKNNIHKLEKKNVA